MPSTNHIVARPSTRSSRRLASSSHVGVGRRRLDGVLCLLGPLRCGGCGARLAAGGGAGQRLGDRFCSPCEIALGLGQTPSTPEPIGRVPWPCDAPLRYDGVAEAWVRRIKYPEPGLTGLDAEARGLLFALARDAASRLPRPDVIVPVPMHRASYLRREFNPSVLFARALARTMGAPMLARALVKRRPTRPQKGLGVMERRANVATAFTHGARLASDASVFLVDDVITTGATLEACISALRRGGLERPGVAVCLARTPSLRDEREGGGGTSDR